MFLLICSYIFKTPNTDEWLWLSVAEVRLEVDNLLLLIGQDKRLHCWKQNMGSRWNACCASVGDEELAQRWRTCTEEFPNSWFLSKCRVRQSFQQTTSITVLFSFNCQYDAIYYQLRRERQGETIMLDWPKGMPLWDFLPWAEVERPTLNVGSTASPARFWTGTKERLSSAWMSPLLFVPDDGCAGVITSSVTSLLW